MDKKLPTVSLWNPLWTIVWSFIFSPLFGSILQRANWAELNKKAEEDNSNLWIGISFIAVLAYLFAEPWLPESAFAEFYFIIYWVALYLLWIVLSGHKQYRYVKENIDPDYHHRLWGKPLMLGAMGLVLWMAISLTYILLLITSGFIDPATINVQ